MQAMVLEKPGRVATAPPLAMRDRPDPVPADDEIALRILACGICRTDLQLCEGDLEARMLPIVPGHQIVGVVDAIGARAKGWSIGERAGVAWLAGACGICKFCVSRRENLCERATFTGWDRDGGYATRVAVRADFAHRLPEDAPPETVAPLLCGGVIGYRALKLSEVKPGGRLGLYGFGASALLTIQVARHLGCEVFVCTRSAREQTRALELGAAWVGTYEETPPAPLDGAITFAPVGSVVARALAALDRGGTLAINAIHLDRIPELDYGKLWWERRIRSVANFTRDDARDFLELARIIPIQTAFETHPLAYANTALARLSRGEVDGAAVLTL